MCTERRSAGAGCRRLLRRRPGTSRGLGREAAGTEGSSSVAVRAQRQLEGQTAPSPREASGLSGRASGALGFPVGWRGVHRARGVVTLHAVTRCDHAPRQSAQEDVSSGPRGMCVAWGGAARRGEAAAGSGRWASPSPVGADGPGRGAGAPGARPGSNTPRGRRLHVQDPRVPWGFETPVCVAAKTFHERLE